MPKPQPNESREKFVERCIPAVIDDGTAKDGEQAAAVCHSMYEDDHKAMKGGDPISDDFLVSFGGAVKSLADGHIGGYLVKFTDAQHTDLEGEFFDAHTDYDFEDGRKTSVYLNHRQPLKTGDGQRVTVKEKIGEGTLTRDADGILIDAILFNAKRYADALSSMGWSSGSAPHLVEYDEPTKSGAVHIARWPLGLDASITPTPANPYGSRVIPIKSLFTADDSAEPEPEAAPEAGNGGTAAKATDVVTKSVNQQMEVKKMEGDHIIQVTPEALQAMLDKSAENAVKAYRATLENVPPAKAAGFVTQDDLDNRASDPDLPVYKCIGEQLRDVANAASAGRPSARLLAAHKRAAKAISGMNETIGADGGFLVQTDFVSQLLIPTYGQGQVLSRITNKRRSSAGANSVEIPVIYETTRAGDVIMGGVVAYRRSEGNSVTASAPKVNLLTMQLHALDVLMYATEELLQDQSLLQSEVVANVPAAFTVKIEGEIFRGTGAGEMKGIIGAGGTVAVAKENGQDADTIVADNILKMWSAALPGPADYAWYTTRSVAAHLMKMDKAVGAGGELVYMPPGGLSGQPYATLMGDPVIIVPYTSALGDAGDIVYGAMSKYRYIDKGDVMAAQSMHVRFIQHEMTFLWSLRCNGQPEANNTVTSYNSADTLGYFVTLAERA